MFFDGRNRAQNGWFVLRSLIPSGRTTGAIVWHLKPDVIPGWARPPVIAHSQVGYAPGFSKVAVLELDPKYTAPQTAKVLRLTAGGAQGATSGATRVQAALPPGSSRSDARIGQDWVAALELTIATHGADPYKFRLRELFHQMITPQQMGIRGWMAVRALPYLDANAKDEMREAVKAYRVSVDKQLDATPFGVPPSLGTWGGSGAVVDMAIRMYFLHKAFPDVVGPEYTLRAVDYILGTHPVSSTSYAAGVGTVSKTKTYGNNRADAAYIPGAVIPGYIIIKPDFPECIDDFGFLWFEDEAVVAGSASWVVAGNAADAITKEAK